MSPSMRIFSYWLEGLLLALTAALILEGALMLDLIVAWLISINVFTLIFYGIDKLNSIWVDENPREKVKKMRIPEAALLLLALAGGSPAAALMVLVLPHKTNKFWFLVGLFLILLAQGIGIYLWRTGRVQL